jgi:tRNA threonylcarbamoyladenosine biosynthesis protein TsaB
MKILALEFSSHHRSVAVVHRRENGETNVLASVENEDFRGVTGLMLIDRALKMADLKPADIPLVAVGLGPGSYAGIRSAIALAQGWQLGRDLKVVGISSTLCLAEEVRLRGISGEVSLIVDAQRGDVYLHRFRLGPEGAGEIEPLRIASRASILAEGVVIGPEASKFIVGAMDLCPSAATLATLANPDSARPAEEYEPIYLRETTFVKAPPPRLID